MARLNQSLFNQAVFNQYIDEINQAGQDSSGRHLGRRSFLLQYLLNYFDDYDQRIRRGTSTIDAQLLNPFARHLEELQMRLKREYSVLDLRRAPLNIDNQGTYYKVQIPETYVFDATADGSLVPPTIRVFTAEQRWTIAREYDDILPVPAGLEISGDSIQCPTLFVHDAEGNGLEQEYYLGSINFPNYLYLTLEGLDANEHFVEVLIEGYTAPRTISLTGQNVTVEKLILDEHEIVRTRQPWAFIKRLTVRDLPAGARLRIAIAPSAFAKQLEHDRPYHHPVFRDQPLQRHWSLKNGRLFEEAFINRISGYENIQSYYCTPPMNAFALEPNTTGIFTVSGNAIYYSDRLEMMPERLTETQIYREPLYNILVNYDEAAGNDIHKVMLEPVQNASSSLSVRFRWIMETPSGAKYCVGPDGSLIKFFQHSGWRQGQPKLLSIPLAERGTYRFVIETADIDGEIFEDVAVYANLTFNPMFRVDISDLLPAAKQLVFDYNQRLWVWTGEAMVPLRLIYHNFVFDQDTRSVYLTQPYDHVEIS